MLEKEIIIVCPCCDAKLWIDRESCGVLKHETPLKDKKNFDGLVSRYKEEKSNVKDAFQKAIEEEEKRKKLLEKKFKLSSENKDN